MKRLNISEQSIPVDRDVNRWPHLNRIEILELKSQKLRTRGEGVRLLIGCNAPEAFWVLEERRGNKGDPVGIRSLLG